MASTFDRRKICDSLKTSNPERGETHIPTGPALTYRHKARRLMRKAYKILRRPWFEAQALRTEGHEMNVGEPTTQNRLLS